MPLGGPVAGAGEPRRRKDHLPKARRAGSWIVWWVVFMALWVWVDDSVLLAELVVGAIAAGLAATLAEFAQYQANTHVRLRAEWIARLVELPLLVVRDTGIVFVALWRLLVRGVPPPSGFREEPLVHGGDDHESDTRRGVMLGMRSAAPNKIALDIDPERDVMVTHQLVSPHQARRSS